MENSLYIDTPVSLDLKRDKNLFFKIGSRSIKDQSVHVTVNSLAKGFYVNLTKRCSELTSVHFVSRILKFHSIINKKAFGSFWTNLILLF